jgi:uncharacterized protein
MKIRTLGYALVGMAALALPAKAADIVIGSSSVGGSYYLYAGGLASYLSENHPDINATARTTRGSVENARLLERAQIDFGFSNGTVVAQQRAGVEQFADAQSDAIRGISVVDRAPTHVVTLRNSGIETLEDLVGKRVSIGAAGSGGANTSMIILQEAGLWDDIDPVNLGFEESATNLRDGNLDAFFGGSALPMPAVMDLSTTHDIRLLSLPAELVDAIQEREPAAEGVIIPAGTYSGIDEDVETLANASLLITHEGMDEETVYEVTKTLLEQENRSYMQSIYRAWNPEPGLELYERIRVPLHPGAERAYREAGLIN